MRRSVGMENRHGPVGHRLRMVGRTPFPGASCYPTTAGRDRAGVRSVNGWAVWISPTRKDWAGRRGEAQEERSGLVDAERLDLRPSVTSTDASNAS